jgi:CRP-like cAMP-binding protein
MLTLVDIPDSLARLHQRARHLARRLGERLASRGTVVRLKAGEDLLVKVHPGLAYVKSGILKLQYEGRLVRLYSDGDMISVDATGDAERCVVESTFASELLVVLRPDLVAGLQGAPDLLHPFTELVALDSRIIHTLCGLYAASEVQPRVAFRRFEPGEVIVAQGESCDEIYELIEGAAEVDVDGRHVGTIRTGEFVGEMSFLTGQPCNATVTVVSPCFVQAIPKSELARLIQARPRVAVRLAELLAARVAKLDTALASALGETSPGAASR